MRCAVVALAAAFALSITLPARAADEPDQAARRSDRIVVVRAPDDRLGKRLVAELESLGFSVVAIDAADGTSSPAALEDAARNAGAVAAMRAVPSERGVEIWIADRATGKTVLREVLRDDPSIGQDGALAVRAVDLLRASLLERSLPTPPRSDVAPTPALAARLDLPVPPFASHAPPPPREPERATTLRLSVLPTVLVSGGGFGPSLSLDLGASWMPSEYVGVVGFVTLPLTRPTISRDSNSADLSAVLGGGAVRFAFTPRASRLTPTGDIGVSVVSIQSSGTAGAGFAGAVASGTAAAPFVGGGVAFEVTRTFRLRADLRVAVMTRPVSIDFAGHQAATWGAPLIMPALGGDFGWF